MTKKTPPRPKPNSRQKNYRRGLDTRARIVDRSIELFNRHGVQNITIEQLAADLQMSPGNITYYFKLRRDLIRAGLEVLQERLGETLERPIVKSPRAAAEYVVRGFRPLWQFRFFFNSLVFLTRSDEQLLQTYYAFRQWAIAAVAHDLEGLITLGYFRAPEKPNSPLLLAENMWSQWLSWLRMQQIEDPQAETPRSAALYDFALHLWSLCQPHLAPGFGKALLKELGEALAPDQPRQAAALRSASRATKSATRRVRKS